MSISILEDFDENSGPKCGTTEIITGLSSTTQDRLTKETRIKILWNEFSWFLGIPKRSECNEYTHSLSSDFGAHKDP